MTSIQSTIPTGDGGGEATPEAVEAVLARCIDRARAAGMVIVADAIAVRRERRGALLACCAVGAHDFFGGEDRLLERPQHSNERYAIEAGFEGRDAEGYLSEWHAVGARLRARYQPVPASSVGGGA